MKYLFSSIVIFFIFLRHGAIMFVVWLIFLLQLLWHFKVTKRSIVRYKNDTNQLHKNTNFLLEFFI